MRKLMLNADDLKVDSFDVAEGETQRGTVQANEDSPHCTITVACDTCYVSCNFTACPADC